MATSYTRYPSLKDRTVFISGGASGIGEEIVRAFAAQGSTVAFVDIQRELGEKVAKSAAADTGSKVVFLPCDLLDIAAVKATIAKVGAEMGPISALVNNAANDLRQEFEEVTPEKFDWMMNINVRHAYFASQAVLPQMRKLGGGSIVNFSSIAWMLGIPNLQAYAAGKSAILGFTKSLARLVGPDHIRVNAIAPGLVLTEKQRTMWFHDDAKLKAHLTSQAIPEAIMPPDIARLVLFLASDDSRMITMQTYLADAGTF